MANPYQTAAGYGAPFSSGFYPYQPYGPHQTVSAPVSAPSPSSYSPHPMAQSQPAAPAPPQPVSANFGHFDANAQRFPFPAPFHAEFPPSVVPANPSPYPPQASGNATDDDDAYDPRYPHHIISSRQPDQAANGSSTRQEGGQDQSHTPRADQIAQAENTGKPSDPGNTHPASEKIHSHPTGDTHKDQPSTSSAQSGSHAAVPPSVESLPSPAAAPNQPFQRHYENSTGPELRRLAKGALLSLSHHNIHYADLVKEGINQHVLASLYDELHIDISPAIQRSTKQTEGPAVNSTNRKDRIAQLLAAKAARASPTRAASDSEPVVAAQSTSQNALTNTEPVADTGTTARIATPDDTGAAPQTEAVEAVHVETVAVPVDKPTTDHVEDTTQLPPLERSATTPLSSLIPGLFMTSDDPINTTDNLVDAPTPAVQTVPVSQKRRRSANDVDHVSEPVSKRQNTTSDVDEGEVMAIDAPSDKDKDASEAKASDYEPTQAPAEKLSSASASQPQREQSASEVQAPSPVPRTQPNESTTNRPAAAPVAASPFGKSPVTSLTPAQMTQRAEMLKARFLRQRAERQKALQDGLPSAEAEVSKARALLAEKHDALSQVDERIQKLQAEISDLNQQKEALGDEISQLEVRLQDGLSGERRLRDELRKLGVEKNATPSKDSPVAPSLAPKDEGPTASQPSEEEKQVEADATKPANIPKSVSEEPEPAPGKAVGVDDQARQDEADYSHTNGAVANISVTTAVDPGDVVRGDKRQEEGPSHDPAGDQTGDVEPVDGYDSDGSASMSDSGSEEEEEYEPADPTSQQAMDIDDALSDEYDPEEAPLHSAPSADPVGVPEDNSVDRSGKSSPSAAPAEHSNMDTAPDDLASEGEVLEDGPSELTNGSSDVTMSNSGQLAALPPPQPSPRSRRTNGSSYGNLRPLSNEAPNHTVTFTPYQSPLNSLKAFRYNQQLNDPTEDGFRSLTLSNTIDPNVPLCPTELSGAECQDRTCREQHFRRFQLTDEQILVQMSKPDDIGDQEAKDEFARGLKELIGQLRSRGIKEFEQVATELSKYRRDFYAPRTGL
ncbi:hypothetical protein DV738_g1100, partial [Chaetothyriales sp. CBS 135597]